MHRRYLIPVLGLAVLATLAPAFQGKKKNDDDRFRMVQGIVTDEQEAPVQGAVVQLKNAKTLQVRSYISDKDGSYRFHGLDPNIDYTLRAEHQGRQSPVRTLSAFDSRKKPVINLKLQSKE